MNTHFLSFDTHHQMGESAQGRNGMTETQAELRLMRHLVPNIVVLHAQKNAEENLIVQEFPVLYPYCGLNTLLYAKILIGDQFTKTIPIVNFK